MSHLSGEQPGRARLRRGTAVVKSRQCQLAVSERRAVVETGRQPFDLKRSRAEVRTACGVDQIECLTCLASSQVVLGSGVATAPLRAVNVSLPLANAAL